MGVYLHWEAADNASCHQNTDSFWCPGIATGALWPNCSQHLVRLKEVRSSSATTWYALSQGVALPPVLSLMRPAARMYAWRMRFSHEHELRVEEVTSLMGWGEWRWYPQHPLAKRLTVLRTAPASLTVPASPSS